MSEKNFLSEKESEQVQLSALVQEKERIEKTEGWEASISSWENLRGEYQNLLHTSEDLNTQDISQKIIEIEQQKQIAEMQTLLKKTEQTKGWKESEEIYAQVLDNIAHFDFSSEKTEKVKERASEYFLLTKIVLLQKEEKEIDTSKSYQDSIELWENLGNKYDELSEISSSKHFITLVTKKQAIEEKKCIAESYAEIKETKKNKNWKSSQEIYSKREDILKKQDFKYLPKKIIDDLKDELCEAQEITTRNILLQEKKLELLDDEKKLLTKGYRESVNGWEKLQKKYSALITAKNIPEKYREIFQKKKKKCDKILKKLLFIKYWKIQKKEENLGKTLS